MKNSVNKKIRNDIILVSAILALALLTFLVFRMCAKEGGAVHITLDGEDYATLPLSEDTTLEIKSENSEERVNVVTVKDGEAYVSYANCPDGICEEHRAIKNTGESIVCLPHGLVITVIGENDTSHVDTVS